MSGFWFFNKKLIGVMIGSDKIRRYVVTPNRRSEKDPLSLYTAVSITAGGATALGSLCDELLKML